MKINMIDRMYDSEDMIYKFNERTNELKYETAYDWVLFAWGYKVSFDSI
jgi:hypothetical protein